jgi:hypothetical protein
MKKFSQFDIKISARGFLGDKIKMSRILNKEIVVHHYIINDSKVYKGKCLQIQISVAGTMHVLFTGSSGLIEAIVQVPEASFPFITIIVEEKERYKFT